MMLKLSRGGTLGLIFEEASKKRKLKKREEKKRHTLLPLDKQHSNQPALLVTLKIIVLDTEEVTTGY